MQQAMGGARGERGGARRALKDFSGAAPSVWAATPAKSPWIPSSFTTCWAHSQAEPYGFVACGAVERAER